MDPYEKAQQTRVQLVEDLAEALEQDIGDWQKTWKTMQSAVPRNAVTGQPYMGSNGLVLGLYNSMSEDPSDNRWCTSKQARAEGWMIKKGSIGRSLSYYKEKGEEKSNLETKLMEPKSKTFMKSYTVYHASQIEGIPKLERPEPEPFQKIEKAERILRESGAVIRHGGNEAFYNRNNDTITLPEPQTFKDPQYYYATALHELGHWTGHESRLNHGFVGDMQQNARKELVAELTSMFVGGEIGLIPDKEHFNNHAAFIKTCLPHLKKDPSELFRATADAYKASNLILQHEHRREREQELQQQIKDMKLIKGDVKVYTNPNEMGNYKGEILHVDKDKGFCVQQVGQVSMVAHRLDKLERVPHKGENLRVTYKANEKAKITAQEREQKREHTR